MFSNAQQYKRVAKIAAMKIVDVIDPKTGVIEVEVGQKKELVYLMSDRKMSMDSFCTSLKNGLVKAGNYLVMEDNKDQCSFMCSSELTDKYQIVL